MEAAAILSLVDRVDERLERRTNLGRVPRARNRNRHGQVGIICRKIAATLSSTGTIAIFCTLQMHSRRFRRAPAG
jgi:hypothetical protein